MKRTILFQAFKVNITYNKPSILSTPEMRKLLKVAITQIFQIALYSNQVFCMQNTFGRARARLTRARR